MRFRLQIFLLALLGTFVFLPLPVGAQNLADEMGAQNRAFAGEQGADFSPSRDPRLIIARIVNVFLSILGTLFIAYTVYAGYLIMTAAGDEDKVDKGKSTLRTAVIGLVIISLSYAISRFVTVRLYYASQEEPGLYAGAGVNFDRQPSGNRDPFAGENDQTGVNGGVVEIRR